jgi:hypothetical protein
LNVATEVWRRNRVSPDQRPTLEYAIVFRGTVGGGGWVSNLRGLTSVTPLVWDQYRQAELATKAVMDHSSQPESSWKLLEHHRVAAFSRSST